MISTLKTYPLTLLTVAVICYLSFFTPPQTELDNISNIDKLVHTCMYGVNPTKVPTAVTRITARQ